MASGIRKWEPEKVIKATLLEQEKRMGRACALVQREIKTLLNVGGGRDRIPSAPGEPPHKQSAKLYGSIHFAVKRDKDSVLGIIYSNDKKARRLELGFVGKDSLGRTYDQKPRPFMRPGFETSKPAARRILGVK